MSSTIHDTTTTSGTSEELFGMIFLFGGPVLAFVLALFLM
ncbi:hypothetical protein BH09ACT12_BH09ACT12_30400 [soil metagenome]